MIYEKRGGALRGLRINREILILRKPPIEVVLHTTQTVIESTCLNITQGCQHPKNVMTYTTAAKTDKPTDWKALWISFGDGAFSKKNDSHGSDLSFNRSSRRGECGLSKYGTCLRFPIFRMGCCGEDDWVVDVAEIPVPTVFEKLFFEKVARLFQEYTCDCDPEYSVEAVTN